MELHLIRHGQTNWNEERRAQGQSDSKLTKIGKEQAVALGKKIKQIKFDKIFCSSSLRTRQTAELVFPKTELKIEYLDSLREIFLRPLGRQTIQGYRSRKPGITQPFLERTSSIQTKRGRKFLSASKKSNKSC